MQTGTPSIVAVRPAAALTARPRLFAALEAAFPVRFVPWEARTAGVSAVIAIAEDPGAAALGEPAVPTFVVGADGPDGGAAEAVRLADGDGVERTVRGIVLHDRLVGSALAAERADVLAHAGASAVWTRSRAAVPEHRVRCALPELEPGQPLYALLSQRAIAAVALVQFLRALPDDAGWRRPPLRAAFVFDDPNLRWRSYGFIDYRALVEHADAHGYHAAMAMIPLDAGRPHRAARSLFLRRPDRLSLVFHGNDHVKHELLAPSDPRHALAMAAQAMRRVHRFERRWGVPVDRVMMPPHGLYSEAVTRALAAVGFDALCAIHPGPQADPRPAAPVLSAWRPADWIGACPVIPRMPLYSTIADIALRAFLDQPVVLYGHHDDVAAGLEPLAEAAARVNHVGAVHWTSVGQIACTNHEQRLDRSRLCLRAYSRRITVAAPAGARAVSVDAPEHSGEALALRGWALDDGPVHAFGADLGVVAGDALDIRLIGVGDVDPDRVPAPAWRPWPRLRRAGTEVRDRMLPLRPVRAR